jgi:hypothetical protein
MFETLAGDAPVDAADVTAVQVSLRPFANMNAFGAQIDAVDAIADMMLPACRIE